VYELEYIGTNNIDLYANTLFSCVCFHMYMCLFSYVHVFVFICSCVCFHMYACVYISSYMYVCVHMFFVFVYVRVCLYLCVCVNTYMFE